MTSRVEELQRMCDNINENGGLDSGEWHTALLAQIAQNLAVIADVMMADRKTEPTISKMEQVDKDINVRSKTMRDCYNCKRYEAEGECVECHYEPKDECAKEYEELGLKELKELIEADRKTEHTEREGE